MTNRITETIGVDLGDRYSAYCAIDEGSGEKLDEGRIRTTPKGFGEFFAKRASSRVVLEVGTHSPWTSRIVSASCAQTLVANPRQLGFIFKNARKSDRMDARLLARVGRLDAALLCPIRHRGLKAQQDLAVIRARAALVSARAKLVNSLRGLTKSFGARIPKQAAKSISTKTRSRVPDELQEAVQPLLVSIEGLTGEIKKYDKLIDELATTHYPGVPQVPNQVQVHRNCDALEPGSVLKLLTYSRRAFSVALGVRQKDPPFAHEAGCNK